MRIIIHNVLYHERFACNLLSSELLVKKYGWQYHSTSDATYVVTPGGTAWTLSSRGRVSVLMGVKSERACPALGLDPGAAQNEAVDQLVQLHARLCHMGWTRMMNLLHGGKVEDHGIQVSSLSESTISAAEKRIRECVACMQGRATRTAFGHRGLDRGSKPGECLHMDTYQVQGGPRRALGDRVRLGDEGPALGARLARQGAVQGSRGGGGHPARAASGDAVRMRGEAHLCRWGHGVHQSDVEEVLREQREAAALDSRSDAAAERRSGANSAHLQGERVHDAAALPGRRCGCGAGRQATRRSCGTARTSRPAPASPPTS